MDQRESYNNNNNSNNNNSNNNNSDKNNSKSPGRPKKLFIAVSVREAEYLKDNFEKWLLQTY